MTAKPIRVEATNIWLSSQPERIGETGWPTAGDAKKGKVRQAVAATGGRSPADLAQQGTLVQPDS